MNRILLIAYYYPPLSSAATYRALNMVKYLKEDSYIVDVLTVEEIDYHSHDDQLINESKANNIFRAKSYDPLALYKKFKRYRAEKSQKALVLSEPTKKIINSFFPIDNKILWFLPAYQKGLQLINKNQYQMIIATIGPYTSALIAYYLSKKKNIPLMIDYRDHWTLNTYKFDYNYFNRLISKYLEKKIIRSSSLISCVSQYMRYELKQFCEMNDKKLIVSYNGFNENDFSNLKLDDRISDQIIIRYFGTFNANRKVDYFIKALKELVEEGYQFTKFQIEFYGVFTSDQINLFQDEVIKSYISFYESVSHKEAIQKMVSSDVLLLFISSNDGKGVITSKIFEYLKTGKMILPMIKQDGDANDLLKQIGFNKSCSMENISSIKEYLIEINERRFNNYPTNFELIENYSRKKQMRIISQEISNVLNSNNNS